MRKYKFNILIIMVMCIFTACGVRKEDMSVGEKGNEMFEELDMINSSECDGELLEIVQKNYEESLINGQLNFEGKIYRSFSVYKNEQGEFEELLTDDEKNELFANEEYDHRANSSSDEWYKITIDESDKRYERIKNGFVTVLLIFDETGEKLLDSMVYNGAIDGRIKQRENSIYWEVSELKSIDIYYTCENKEYIRCWTGYSNNSVYEFLVNENEVKSKKIISDEEDVRYMEKEIKDDRIKFLYSEIRTLTMKELVGDKELCEYASNLASTNEPGAYFELDVDKYGMYNNTALSGFVSYLYMTTDGYGIFVHQSTPFYFKITKEEYMKRFKEGEKTPLSEWVNHLGVLEGKELLYVNGDINPKLLKELESKS